MQKPPPASRASVLVLLLVLITTSIEITSVDGGVCLDPGPSGTYNVACNRATVGYPETPQFKYLLLDTRLKYINAFPNPTSCMKPFRNEADPRIVWYRAAVCREGMSSDSCGQCLLSAIQVIEMKCDIGAIGAQASSVGCCIRYENKPFCTP
ncbi:hypothetical protein LINGRAHAP2_LOCUS12153 [Linum grandiflorum]